jgi:hypothetical protein
MAGELGDDEDADGRGFCARKATVHAASCHDPVHINIEKEGRTS